MKFSTGPGRIVEQHLTIRDFPKRRDIDKCFARLEAFRKEALEKLAERFPTLGRLEDLDCFAPERPLDLQGCNKALRSLADFFKFDRAAFVLDCERLLIAFHKREDASWPAFLARGVEFSEQALWALYTFLLAQSESAACERIFAQVSNLSRTLREQGDGQLVEQYLHLSNGPEFPAAAEPGGLLDRVVAGFLAARERRQASAVPGTWTRKGARVFLRRRRLRSDAGSRRKSYRATKRHARLREEPKLRGLVRQADEPAEQPAARLEPALAAACPPSRSPFHPRGQSAAGC